VGALVNLSGLLDEAKCFEFVRQMRWPRGVLCPKCGGGHVARNGHDDTRKLRQRYVCRDCHVRFDDLSDTVLAGHRQPFRVWVLCVYFMGLNLSNPQIARELRLNESDVQEMTTHLRQGLAARAPEVVLPDAVVSAVRFAGSDPRILIETVRASGVKRYLVGGGAGSLDAAPGVMLIDAPQFPAAYKRGEQGRRVSGPAARSPRPRMYVPVAAGAVRRGRAHRQVPPWRRPIAHQRERQPHFLRGLCERRHRRTQGAGAFSATFHGGLLTPVAGRGIVSAVARR